MKIFIFGTISEQRQRMRERDFPCSWKTLTEDTRVKIARQEMKKKKKEETENEAIKNKFQ